MTQSLFFLILFLVVLVFSVILVFSLVAWLRSIQRSLDDARRSINDSLFNNTRVVHDSLTKTTKDIYDRLTYATDIISDLKKEAGAFAEISRSMRDLQEFLSSPKLRGNIGESILSDLLSQVFPRQNFALQYSFQSGEKVDAVIRTDAGLLPIDSKFPMENYQKMISAPNPQQKSLAAKSFAHDIKKHLATISSKYILPAEGTLDFALMYVPSEAVYYELAKDAALMDYARSLRVYPVSPNTMYATLQTILLSFEGRKIEHKAKEVFALLRSLSRDYAKATTSLTTLGNHLTNAYHKYNDVQHNFGQIGQKLDHTRLLES